MIDVEKTDRERQAPAANPEELFDRLSVHVGRVVKVEVLGDPESYSYGRSRNGYRVVGTLDSILLENDLEEDAEEEESLLLVLGTVPADKESNEHEVLRKGTRISVLTDGRWVPIHEPEGRN